MEVDIYIENRASDTTAHIIGRENGATVHMRKKAGNEWKIIMYRDTEKALMQAMEWVRGAL